MTPDMRKTLGMKDNPDDDDGEFWMDISDFKKFFYSTTICHYRLNYKNITVADTHAETEHACSRVDVLEDIDHATFILTQMHKRFATTWPDDSHEYAPL